MMYTNEHIITGMGVRAPWRVGLRWGSATPTTVIQYQIETMGAHEDRLCIWL